MAATDAPTALNSSSVGPYEELARQAASLLNNVPRKGTSVLMQGTKQPKTALGTILLGRTRTNILSLMYAQPERKLYLREIIRLAGGGQGAVQRELAQLVRVGLLLRTRAGNLVYFQANRAAPVFEELRGLVRKTAGIPELLRTALLPLAESILRAFVYGSVAHGTETADSDVDLMVVGDVSFFDVVSAVSPLQETLGRDINPTVFPLEEYRRKLASGDPFLTQVERTERIELIGGVNESRSVGQSESDRRSPAKSRSNL